MESKEQNTREIEEMPSEKVKYEIIKYHGVERRCHNCWAILNDDQEVLCEACRGKNGNRRSEEVGGGIEEDC